jgi:uncharacterized protein (DUF1499 family)
MAEVESPVPPSPAGPRHRPISPLAITALALAIIVALMGALGGFGTRWGFWHFRTGFTMVRWAVYGGIGVGLLSIAALAHARPAGPRKGFALAFLALVITLVVVTVPLQVRRSAAGVPPIHDITTDTENPPEFVAIAPLRADAPNPVEYGGAEIASHQRQAYPDIRPLILDLPAEAAFDRALDAARSMGWEVVAVEPAEGRIEAADRTFWFGFRDDVVIRVTPAGNRSIIDARSKSRVGRGDMGTNARRVREYLQAVQSR